MDEDGARRLEPRRFPARTIAHALQRTLDAADNAMYTRASWSPRDREFGPSPLLARARTVGDHRAPLVRPAEEPYRAGADGDREVSGAPPQAISGGKSALNDGNTSTTSRAPEAPEAGATTPSCSTARLVVDRSFVGRPHVFFADSAVSGNSSARPGMRKGVTRALFFEIAARKE